MPSLLQLKSPCPSTYLPKCYINTLMEGGSIHELCDPINVRLEVANGSSFSGLGNRRHNVVDAELDKLIQVVPDQMLQKITEGRVLSRTCRGDAK